MQGFDSQHALSAAGLLTDVATDQKRECCNALTAMTRRKTPHKGGLDAEGDLLAHGIKDGGALLQRQRPNAVCHCTPHPWFCILPSQIRNTVCPRYALATNLHWQFPAGLHTQRNLEASFSTSVESSPRDVFGRQPARRPGTPKWAAAQE